MNALVQPTAGTSIGSTSELRPIKKVPHWSRTWTEEMDDRLRELHEAGAGFSAIGAELGVSRNAAIGRAHRIGLKGRAEAIRWQKRASAPLIVKPPRTASGSEPKRGLSGLTKRAKSRMVTFAELAPHHCRWPCGDPLTPEFRYCGGDREEDGPYCRFHFALAHNREAA